MNPARLRLARLNSSKGPGAPKVIELDKLRLGDFMKVVSKRVPGAYGLGAGVNGLSYPHHLEPLLKIVEPILKGESVYALASTPPQHGKTALICFLIAAYLRRFPGKTVVYATYNLEKAHATSTEARQVAKASGVKLANDAKGHWRTEAGGGCLFTSTGGSLVGVPNIGLIIIDDPYNGRADAESPVKRAEVEAWVGGSVVGRMSPALIVIHTRWHVEDLIAFLQEGKREDGSPFYQYLNLTAICDVDEGDPIGRKSGEALWESNPQRCLAKLKELLAKGVSEYEWQAQYQGNPVPKGLKLFQDAWYYTELPKTGLRYSIGVDLAYSEHSRSDWSVAVVMAECYDGPLDENKRPMPRYYVTEVIRRQVQAPDFVDTLKYLHERHPGAHMFWYMGGGGEKGNASFFRRLGVPLITKRATDKYAQALPTSASWNARPEFGIPGRVLLPEKAPWLEIFLREVNDFTGKGDEHDDQVDALAGAHDVLVKSADQGAGGGGGSVGGSGRTQSWEERGLGW